MSDPEFTLTIRRVRPDLVEAVGAYRIERDSDPGEGPPVALHLDAERLLALADDPLRYGRLLTQMVFGGGGPLLDLWRRAAAHPRLRVRVRLDGSIDLQQICWETLFDPDEPSGVPLGRKPHVFLSRTLVASGAGRAIFRGRPSALLVAASPRDLPTWLAPIDAAEEERRLRAMLPAALPLRALGGRPDRPPASLRQIGDALGAGHLIVYLVCHGMIDGDQAAVILENEDGAQQRVSVRQLVEQLYRTPVDLRPLLVVLGSCKSAGGGALPATTAALGPLLIEAQVPAVIGMQGNVEPRFVASFVARCFESLFRHGSIDQAVAETRAAIAEDGFWWQPVLFSRLPGGQLFARRAPEPIRTTFATPSAAELFAGELSQLDQSVRDADDRSRKLATCKAIHDELHDLTYICAVLAEIVARREGNVREHLDRLDLGLEKLVETVSKASFVEPSWVNEMAEDVRLLRAAPAGDWDGLGLLLVPIESTLNTRLPQFNTMLRTLASEFSLQRLIELITRLRPLVDSRAGQGDAALEPLRDPAPLQALFAEVGRLVKAHDSWQEIVVQLERIIADYRWRQEGAARALSPRARLEHQLQRGEQLCGAMRAWLDGPRPDRYARALSEKLAEFLGSHAALARHLAALPRQSAEQPAELSAAIDDLRAAAGLCFFHVDSTLRNRCENLSERLGEVKIAASRVQVQA